MSLRINSSVYFASLLCRSGLFALVLTIGCTPSRTPIPPGEIPDPPEATAADRQAAEQASRAMLQNFREETDPRLVNRVERILDRLLTRVGSSEDWSVTVLRDSRIANAAATRGPALFVWTGMLEQLPDDEMLAAVMAHEVAHVLAGHVVPDQAEVANRVLAQVAGALAGRVVESPAGAQIAGSLAEKTVQGLIVNPYSQRLELEADTVGMFLMADAGYDPAKAIELWKILETSPSRMAAFFSTHPPSNHRIENLQQNLAKAQDRYASRRAR